MPRSKVIPDSDVHATIRRLLAEGGDKAVAFGPVARATGLAAATLVQRFGTRDGMVRAALIDAWDSLDTAIAAAEAITPTTTKGAQDLLKRIGSQAHQGADLALLAINFRDASLRARAASWRARVEGALALRLGGGSKGREAAILLFAIWQGQILWADAGGKEFKIKDAVKRLT